MSSFDFSQSKATSWQGEISFPGIIGSLFKNTDHIWNEVKTQTLECIQQKEVALTSTGACSSLKPYLVSLGGNTAWVIQYLLLLHYKALKEDSLLQKPTAFNAIAERRCDYKVRLESSFLTKFLNKVCFIFFWIEYLQYSLVNYIYKKRFPWQVCFCFPSWWFNSGLLQTEDYSI